MDISTGTAENWTETGGNWLSDVQGLGELVVAGREPYPTSSTQIRPLLSWDPVPSWEARAVPSLAPGRESWLIDASHRGFIPLGQ